MKVLLITYYFPPTDYGATNRLMRLLPGLENEEIEFHVLTVLPGGRVVDDSLNVNIPKVKSVVRTRQFMPPTKAAKVSVNTTATASKPSASFVSRAKHHVKKLIRQMISIPDGNVGWYRFAVQAGLRETREKKFDLIFSTSPSRTVHMIAATLQHKTSLPWVADFRDSWFDYGKKDFWFKKIYNERLLFKVLNNASAAIFTSRNLADYYRKLYPDWSNKFHFLPHGIEDVKEKLVSLKTPVDEFWIGYIGSMDKLRSPAVLLRTLSLLKHQHSESYKKIRIKFVGALQGDFFNEIRDHECSEKFDFVGFVPRQTSLNWMYSCDCLLIMLSEVEWIGLGACASKIYDYFAIQKPVVGLVPQGYIYDLIREMNAGNSFTSAQVDDAAQYLHELISGERNIAYNIELINQFKVKPLAQKFVSILASQLPNSKNGRNT